MATFNEKVLQAIPSEFFMISSSKDTQQSNEAYNTSAFELPNPAGKEGGACTSAFLNMLYEHPDKIGKMSWVYVLKQMRKQLQRMGYDQVPQLSSSRFIDVEQPMYICPPHSGRRRAILIGINYVGQKGELKACHNDVTNLQHYLINVQGFDPDEMLVLMDDGQHPEPTKENIEKAFDLMCRYSQPNDVVFCSFSGHGGNVADRSGDEEDGMDETLIPVDFATAGHIVDDDILDIFVRPMNRGVTVTVLMDCCHSGTVMDLPYCFSPEEDRMRVEKGFPFEPKAEREGTPEQQGGDGTRAGPGGEDEPPQGIERYEDKLVTNPNAPEPKYNIGKYARADKENYSDDEEEGDVKKRKRAKDLPPPPPPPGASCCTVT